MAGQAGSALYLEWVHAAGTTVLNADFKDWNYSPSIDYVEDTAGADTHKHYQPGLKSGQASLNFIHQAGGSVILNALKEGTEGTLIWGPEGTAAGKPKKSMAAICGGAVTTQPYADVVSVAVTWQQNGERTDGSY